VPQEYDHLQKCGDITNINDDFTYQNDSTCGFRSNTVGLELGFSVGLMGMRGPENKVMNQFEETDQT
jgi:hypothetical protein